ncbi:hypothetical protein KCV87_06320 [Actinosynnema pretiosum subsp. pretiosum]|uniref:N-acetyltransferase domain-containing protein n=1 Tax=Actinosynnema pretiosum subsp. pretiosum TaxID=103721 RepID=A0AA45R586_9PSEU|nr:hypothetical protein APASM_2771 [Actinosynnema pretiosum subsp. pretiosum]QUF05701.1 hypothetical protein KCV87_06320 [Actinosynnema pretiosum subsp. pretiosum]
MSPLPGPDAAALRALGLSDEVADLLAGSEQLLDVAGEPVVLTAEVDGASGGTRALATFLGPSSDAAVAEVVAIAADRHPEAAELVLVLPPGRTPPASGAPLLRYALATGGIGPVPDAAGWVVRDANDNDAVDVVPLYAEALPHLADVDPWELQEHCLELFDEALEEGAVFVAHGPTGFAGHLTLIPDEDELTGSPRLEVFDRCVVGEAVGTPVAALLTWAAVEHARAEGLPLRACVHGDGAEVDAALESLLAEGWRRDEVCWAVPLRGADPSGAGA